MNRFIRAGIEDPEYIFERYCAKKFEGCTVPVRKDSCRGHKVAKDSKFMSRNPDGGEAGIKYELLHILSDSLKAKFPMSNEMRQEIGGTRKFSAENYL